MEILLCDLLILLILVGAVSSRARHLQFRVYKGTEDTLHEFPFVVSLDIKLKYRYCTGSAISNTFVITAGHCMTEYSINEITIRYADFTVNPNETKAYVNAVKMYLHPNYIDLEVMIRNDIGLVRTENMFIKDFAKLSAVDSKALLGLPVKYAGFGDTTRNIRVLKEQHIKNNSAKHEPLQVGEGVVVTCPDSGSSGWIPSLCVAPKCSGKKQQPYNGDSGGPLICDGKLVAVVSGSSVDSEPINTFTPVSSNLQWISGVLLKAANRG